MACVSILILTLNEENNIRDCLESVGWCDDIVVLDSGSTDRTLDIARQKGCRCVTRPFDDWARHQNWAVSNIVFKHKWVFYLDADERMTPELKQEILRIADSDCEEVAFYCGRKNYFMGRWIKHCFPPAHIMRFFIPTKIRFERPIHVLPIVDGKSGFLLNHFDHYNFSKGVSEWIDKHNRYSSMEAIECLKVRSENLNWFGLFTGDAANKRKHLKRLAYFMPLRPLLKFLYLYFAKLGFLDGSPGFFYCILQAFYEYLIDLKVREQKDLALGKSW